MDKEEFSKRLEAAKTTKEIAAVIHSWGEQIYDPMVEKIQNAKTTEELGELLWEWDEQRRRRFSTEPEIPSSSSTLTTQTETILAGWSRAFM